MVDVVLPIKYTEVDGAEIAYQVVGDGPVAYLGTPGLAQNIDILWEEPLAARFLRRHAEFSRFLLFDKRGTGLSARQLPSSFAERIEDMRAVLDAEHVDRAFIGGYSDGGSMSALFAATYPDRAAGLLLGSTTPSWVQRDDVPWQVTPEQWTQVGREWSAAWGTGRFTVDHLAPSMAANDEYVAWMARYERQSMTPRRFADLWTLTGEIDVRAVLPTIRVPTLVLHRADETLDDRNAHYLADRIPDAKLVILPGRDHLPWIGDQETFMDEVEEFVTGARHAESLDRVLATVLFTDIVNSTRLADALGDARWRTRLDEHDAISARAVARHGGRMVKTTGDGVLATFELPSRAVHAAIELHHQLGSVELDIRAGVHTGEVERRGDDVGGVAVHVAARVAALAGPGEVLASSTVKELSVGSDLTFQPHGRHHLRGFDEQWALYSAASRPSSPTNAGRLG